MFKKSKSAFFLMGSFLGGLGASFVSYAANDAGSLLEDIDTLDDFNDDNLGRLVFDDKVKDVTPTGLNIEKRPESEESFNDLNIPEPGTPEVYVDSSTAISDPGEISDSSGGEIGENLDKNIVPSTDVTDLVDISDLNNKNFSNNLGDSLGQNVISSGEINGSYINNDANTNLVETPVENVTVTDLPNTENLSDLYPQSDNNKMLDTSAPVAPTKDVPNFTKTKDVHRDKINSGKNKKSVDDKNSRFKNVVGLTIATSAVPLALKYNKELKSSGWLNNLTNKVKNLWTPAVAATSDSNKNSDVTVTQQTDEKKPSEEPIVPIPQNVLDKTETVVKSPDQNGVPGEATNSAPNENIDQDQDFNRSKGASTFGILAKILGIGTITVLSFYFLRNKLKKGQETDKGKKEGNSTNNPEETKKSLVQQLRENFESGDNNRGVGKDSTEDNKNKEIKRSKSTKNIQENAKKEQLRNVSVILTHKNLADILAEKELKEEAVKNAVNDGVNEKKVEEIIKKEYQDVVTYKINLEELDIVSRMQGIKKKIQQEVLVEKGDITKAVEQKLPGVVKEFFGETINRKIEETKSNLEKEKKRQEQEEKQRLENENLQAVQKIINEAVIPNNVKKIIKGAFKDLETYHISVDEIYKEGENEVLGKQIDAKEIVNVNQDNWQATVENKLKEKVGEKYRDTVKNKVNETIQSAQNFINQYVTAEKVKEVAESILTENRIIKGKIEEKKEKAILRIFGIDILCTEEKLLELKRKITADEIAKVENNAWGSTVGEKIKDLIKNSVTKKVENFRDILKKMLKSKDEISKRIIAKKYLQKFKNMANKLKKEEGVSRIGANFKGYLARKKLGKLKKRKELLKKIVENEDFKDKQLAVKNSFFKLKNVNEKLKSAEKAIEDGITEGKIKEIIQTEYIKKNKAITADAIYKSLNVNIDALKEKIKVEEIAKLKKEEVAGAVQEKLKEVLKNKYGKNIENKIQEAMRKEKERIEKEEEERKKKEKLNNENKIEEEKKDDIEKKKILEIYGNFKKNRMITKKDDVIKIEILSSRYPEFLKEGFLKGNKDNVKERDILVFELLKHENNVVLKAKRESKVNQEFFQNTSAKGKAWYNAFYTFERSSDLLDFLSLDANNINSSSRKNLRDNDISAPITSQKKDQNKDQLGSGYKKINNTTGDEKKEKEKNNEKKDKYNINLNLISEFNKQDDKSNKKNHFECRILYTNNNNNNNNNIIRPNNYSPIKNEIIIDDRNKTDHKLWFRAGTRREYLSKKEEKKINVDEDDSFEEGEKTERESNTEKKPPLPYRRKYTIKVDNSSELKNKMFEKTVPFENIKEIFTKYRDKLVELGKENYKKDGSTFSVESSDMKELKLTYYWKNGKVCNSGSFILEQKRQGKKEVWIFSHNVEKSADGAKKEQKEICKMEELRPQCLKTVFENMSSFFKKITCCSSSFYVKYMNKTNKFVFENDIKAYIPYYKYGYNNHNNYYNNNDY